MILGGPQLPHWKDQLDGRTLLHHGRAIKRIALLTLLAGVTLGAIGLAAMRALREPAFMRRGQLAAPEVRSSTTARLGSCERSEA